MGRDTIAGLVVLVFSTVLFGLTFRIQSNSLVPVSPAFYPRLVLGATALLSLLMVVLDLAKRRRAAAPAAPRPAGVKLRYDMVAILFAIFAVYVVVLPYLGYRIASMLFLGAMQFVMARPKTVRGWVVLALVALLATAATYAMFEMYLQVLLPRGRWTDF